MPLSMPSNGFSCALPDMLGNRCGENTRGRMKIASVGGYKIRRLGLQNSRPKRPKFVTWPDGAGVELGTSLDFQGDERTIQIQMADRPRRPRRKAGIVF